MSQPEALGSFRKRTRSKCGDDGGCDFTPLSKRINNLHLDRPDVNGDSHCHSSFGQIHTANGSSSLEQNLNGTHWGGGTSQHQEETTHVHLATNSTSQQGDEDNLPWMRQQLMAQYAPILDQTDNPHYYENNKLLFALFMERLQRISPL